MWCSYPRGMTFSPQSGVSLLPATVRSSTDTPALLAMKPRTEKTTNPARMEAVQFKTGTVTASLVLRLWNMLYEPKLMSDPQPGPKE